jgi:hypothetical protein
MQLARIFKQYPTIVSVTLLLVGGSWAAAPAATDATTPAASTRAPLTDLGVSCLVAPTKLADDVITAFLAQPQMLLSRHPNGGLALSDEVRGLAASSSATLSAILALVPGASGKQQAAIGAGLARSIQACQINQLDYATRIQNEVGALNNTALLTGFTGALGGERVGSIGVGTTTGVGPGANGSSSVSPLTGQFGAGNSFTKGGDHSVVTQSESFSFGGAGAFAAPSVSP